MSNYDHTLTLSIPADMYDVACAISRALDPDTGGAASWGPQFIIDPLTLEEMMPAAYTTSTPCTESFYQQAQAMLTDPAMLHYAVTQDYADRWPDLVPPTLEECEQFCAGVVMVVPELELQIAHP